VVALAVCEHCGSQLIPMDKSCWNCGQALTGDALVKAESQIAVAQQPTSPQYAGFWDRGLAWLVDYLLIFIAGAGAYFLIRILGLDLFDATGRRARWLIPFIAVVGLWLYFAGMESSDSQATFGKRFMGLRVTDVDGNRISFGRATVRFAISQLFELIPFGLNSLDIVPIMFTKKRQAVHDLIAKTLVLNGS
jgi:uncharacterized RDD family membrane protein YckC